MASSATANVWATCIVELQGDIILTETQFVWPLILCSLLLRKSVPQIQKLFRIVATEHMSPTNFNKACCTIAATFTQVGQRQRNCHLRYDILNCGLLLVIDINISTKWYDLQD